MVKAYIIIAHDGTEIIDNTPEAEIRIAALDDLEERVRKEHRRKPVKNPLYRLTGFCGIIGG